MEFDKKIMLLVLINFVLLLFGVYSLATSCGGTISACLLENEQYFSDFNFHFNIIKYISVHGSLPLEVVYFEDGGYDGISSEAFKFPFHRAPLYYWLGALIYLMSKMIGVLPLLSLHIFSTVIILITNILFFFFIKRLSRFVKTGKKKFILYSMVLFMFLPPQLYIALGVQTDVLVYLFFVASLYAYIRLVERKTNKGAVLLGLFIGLSLLSHLSALPMVAALVLILGYYLIKRDYISVKLYSISLFTSLIVGGFTFIRNKILSGSFIGNLLVGVRGSPPQKSLDILIRSYRGFWGGIEGGNNNLYFFLVFICLALTVLIIYGLLVFKKEIKNKPINIFFIILFFIIIIFTIDWACKTPIFLTSFKCIGYEIQSRFVITLCPLIALFSSLGLINLEKKSKYLAKITLLFVVLTAVLFSIDFVTALLKL